MLSIMFNIVSPLLMLYQIKLDVMPTKNNICSFFINDRSIWLFSMDWVRFNQEPSILSDFM